MAPLLLTVSQRISRMLLRTFSTSRSLLRLRSTFTVVRCLGSSLSHPPPCALWSRTASSPELQKFTAVRQLSTSPCRRVPWFTPLVVIIGRKALRFVAMFAGPIMEFIRSKASRLVAILAGSLIRKWCKALSKDKRHLLLAWYQNHRRIVLTGGASVFAVIGLYYASHIERAPMTGRIRFITVTHTQLQKLAEFGLEELMAFYSDYLLPDTDRRVIMVRRTLARLIRSNEDIPGINEYNWSVLVVDEPTVCNAFVLPTGHIFFFTGMLDTMENEDQLAIILSHEMAHTLLGHVLEKLSYANFLDWIKIVMFAAIWTIVPSDGIAFVTTWFYNLCHHTALHLPYSRKLEVEADAVGLQIAAKACFDVRESYAFWIGMQLDEKVKEQTPVPTILSTHPNHDDRAQRLKSLIDGAVALRTLCNCPPLDLGKDPVKRADRKKFDFDQQLALQDKV